jgi:hypothetical protein
MRWKIIIVMLFFSGIIFAQEKRSKNGEKLTDTGKSNFFTSHSPKARDFHSFGHSLFFDLNLSPIKAYAPEKKNSSDTLTKFSRISEYSIYHISYYFRYNIFQPSNDKAVTLTFNPGIGFGVSQSKRVKGFGAFTGGAYIGYEWGNGSTYRSEEERGAFIRLGAEYNYTPLIITSKTSNEHESKYWIGPSVSFGVRKENQKEKLVETNFKIGWGLNKVTDDENAISPYAFARPVSFRFSFVIFMDH